MNVDCMHIGEFDIIEMFATISMHYCQIFGPNTVYFVSLSQLQSDMVTMKLEELVIWISCLYTQIQIFLESFSLSIPSYHFSWV